MNYTPLNYASWNFSGKGENISHLLLPTEQRIWKEALPFQDKRDDKGHAEFVAYFVVNLLNYLNVERKVVVPAAILHDIGWSQMSKEEIAQFYLPNWRDFEPQLRKKHQEEGVKLARKILEELNYTSKHVLEILEIISQHDTRKGFLSQEDGVVRDADKLWRFTLPCCELEIRKKRNFGISLYNQRLKWLSEWDFFYSDVYREIAKIEFQSTLNNLDEAQKNYLKNR